MGHERISILPKTKRWQAIASEIANFDSRDNDNSFQILEETLNNVRKRYSNIYHDSGVISAFEFIVIFAASFGTQDPQKNLSSFGIKISEEPKPLEISKQFRSWISRNINSLEYGEIAQAALADTIVHWYDSNKTEQTELFRISETFTIWKKTGNGSGFCELARLFFANLTERYIKYFLEREASATIRDVEQRDLFNKRIERHIDDISRHTFETAKITQSFAAGWFNKYAKETVPDKDAIRSFLRLAFEKMREEILREIED
jgi:hypothetical protein